MPIYDFYKSHDINIDEFAERYFSASEEDRPQEYIKVLEEIGDQYRLAISVDESTDRIIEMFRKNGIEPKVSRYKNFDRHQYGAVINYGIKDECLCINENPDGTYHAVAIVMSKQDIESKLSFEDGPVGGWALEICEHSGVKTSNFLDLRGGDHFRIEIESAINTLSINSQFKALRRLEKQERSGPKTGHVPDWENARKGVKRKL